MLLFMVVSLIMFVSMVMFAGATTGGPPPAPLPMAGPAGVVSIAITILFAVVFLLHCFTMVEGLCLLAYYIYHVFTTDRLPQDKKALWAVVIFLGSAIAMPIYWYLYIWKEPQAGPAGPPVPIAPTAPVYLHPPESPNP